ncbi:MAG: glycosyltransferase family 39 protein, partial [Myxococcales bacterium]|nr:glycosyltransferase family 39 protein [Myxococcales bacterium]
MNEKERLVGLLTVFVAHLGIARITHVVVYRSFPFTDDEVSLRFGGQVLASGSTMIPIPEWMPAMPGLFLFARDGMLTSFDWIGSQLPWALGILTGTGTLVFAVFAALGSASVGLVATKRLGTPWGLMASLLFIVSPMGFALSGSSHAHVVSRGLIAATLAFYTLAEMDRKYRWWFCVGLAGGLSAITRPIETTSFLLPLFLHVAWRSRQEAATRRGLLLILAGALGPLLVLLGHQYLVTGSPLTPVRWAKNEFLRTDGGSNRASVAASLFDPGVLWHRFGRNFSYNVLLLSIFGGGVVGTFFATLGVRASSFARLLGLGVALSLSVALVHDNPGIHVVGPIHYSELLVPIVLLCVFGIERVYRFLSEKALYRQALGLALLGAFVVGLLSFDFWHGKALREQAYIHQAAEELRLAPEVR